MTIPNVTMTWCQRQAKCSWCTDPIKLATPMVNVFYWNKGTPDHKGFNTRYYYHPDCWIEQGLDYLKRNPFVSAHQPRLPLTDEQKKARNKLLNRWSSLNQQIRNIKVDYPERVLEEARLEKRKVDLMLEIAPLGGIPKKWLTPPE